MRCFLAIDLPSNVKEELSKIQKQLPKADMKIVEKENIHLTLKFLGEINDFQVNKIKEVLKKVKADKFNASLGKVGVFPSENFIRVVWVAMGPYLKVKELHDKIDVLLEKEKFRKDNHQFESHITLARVKFIKNKEEFVKKLREIKINPFDFEVKGFYLKKSELTNQGPVYEDIIEFDLE